MPFPDFDPVLIHIGPFAIRWYALAYVAGILLGWRYAVTILRAPRLWTRRPDMNVAIATGGDGPDVLDVDVAHGKPGYSSLHAAIRAGLVPLPMGRASTPSGGMHLHYRVAARVGNAPLVDGVDIRGDGDTADARVQHHAGFDRCR